MLERHYATFSFDTQFLNAALLAESPARLYDDVFSSLFLLASHTSLCFVFIADCIGTLSFSGANENAARSGVFTRVCVCVCVWIGAHATSGHEMQKIVKNRGALTHVVCDSFTRRETSYIFFFQQKLLRNCLFLGKKINILLVSGIIKNAK